MNVHDTLAEMRKDYSNFLKYYMEHFPFYAQSKIKHYSWLKALALSFVLQIIVLLFGLLRLSKPPIYIFQGLRHEHLLKILSPSDVMIIGGRREFSYCRKMGYRFHWVGYIDKAFDLLIFANKTSAISDVVLFIQNYFALSGGQKNYLFLWEDTQASGLTLSLSLRDSPSVNVVCITHGYDYAVNKDFPNDMNGLNCNFNFVYDTAQTKFYDTPTTFVLGLPYEVKPADTIKHKVVLVEHATRAFGAEYVIAVSDFIKIFNILKKSGFDVTYRTRPAHDYSYIRSIFPDICDKDKHDLFAEGRMIFVGHNSTLLYEAKILGNIVVGLDTGNFMHDRNFDVDYVLLANEYDKVAHCLNELDKRHLVKQICTVESLSSRFFACIKSIDSFNKIH